MAARRDKILKEAEKLVQKGKVEQAINEYEKLLKDNPTDANTINRVGDLYGRIGQIDKAIELYERIAKHFTQDGFTTKAIAIFKKINRLAPQRLDIFDQLADLYIQQGLVIEAKSQYQILADWYVKNGDHERAIETHRKLVQLDPSNHMAHLRLADLLIQQGEADQALEVYDRLGRVLLEREKLDEAERLYRHALEQNPPGGEFLVPLCEALLDAGRAVSAREFLEEAFKRSPDSYTLQELQVRTHLVFGEADEALGLTERVLDDEPEKPGAKALKGRALLAADRHGEAREVLVPACEELLDRGEYSVVQQLTKELVDVFPNDLQVLNLAVRAFRPSGDEERLRGLMSSLADACFEAENFERANRLYMELLEGDPENRTYRDRLAKIQNVEPDQVVLPGAGPGAPAEGEEIDEIEVDEDLAAAMGTAPAAEAEAADFDPRERLTEAKVFAKYGLSEKAESHLEGILEVYPDQVEARALLVSMLVDRGEKQEALSVAGPLLEHYKDAEDDEALNAILNTLPVEEIEEVEEAAELPELDEDVIVLDLDEDEMELVEAESAEAVIDLGPAEAPEIAEAAEMTDGAEVDEAELEEPAASAEAAPSITGPEVAALDQLDSFIDQDLNQDAIRLLGRLEHEFPGDPEVVERRLALKAKGVLLEEVVAVSSGPEELFADEEESFVDLAKELEDELAEEEALVEEATGRGKEEAVLEDVFREFQRGVEEQLSEEDSDTHFNLGIAYKEMGLLPEAIREFQVSSRDGELFVESCSMIGVCYMEQGMWSNAAEWYQKALEAPDLSVEAQLALRYDLASSLESAGDLEGAMGCFEEVVAVNPGYRDVSDRLDQLAEQGQIN
jgi:tetratricopeptide (TPR) repeat protein